MKSWHTGWLNYKSSCKELIADINELGEDAFEFEILVTCKGVGQLRAAEIMLQLQMDVLNQNSYNKCIGHLRWMNSLSITPELIGRLKQLDPLPNSEET